MNVVSLDARMWNDSQVDRSEVTQIVEAAAQEAARLLPSEFNYLNIVVSPAEPSNVIPETGCMGVAYSDEYISMTFDPALPYGETAFRKYLREMVFHEITHAVMFANDPWQPSAMYGVMTEGVASVFERDYANGNPLWGKYESDEVMQSWYSELKSLPQSTQKDTKYFFKHPDGRRWIVYKTGVWVVDKLLAGDEDLFDLMQLTHQQIMQKFEAL